MNLREHTIQLLQKHGLWAQKKFGQNFLVNEHALAIIIESGEIQSTDTIVEIGPGTGILPKELATKTGAQGNIITIEKDAHILPILRDNLASLSFADQKKITIVQKDALKTELPKTSYKIIANIPYNITSPLLVRFLLETKNRPQLMVLLVQKEVAEKVCAKTPDMNLLALLVQAFGKPHIVKMVSAHDFLPPPKVESAILKVEMYPQPAVSCNIETFFRVVRAGFAQKRKTISNALKNNLKLDPETVKNTLQKANIDPIRRAETLSIMEWEEVVKAMEKQ